MITSVFKPTAFVALTAFTTLCLVGVSKAATVIYTSKSDFLAVTTGITTVDFEGLTPPDTAIVLSDGTTNPNISGVTFNNTAGFLVAINCATLPSPFANCDTTIPLVGATTVVENATSDGSITATLPSGITAVGVDLLPYNIGFERTVTISTGDSQTVTVGNAVSFIGFTSTTPITFLTMNPSNGGHVFDNVVYGQANVIPNPNPNPNPTTTPEPSLVLGLLLVGMGRMRGVLKRDR